MKLQRENRLQTHKYISIINENIKLLSRSNVKIKYRIVFVDSIYQDIEFVISALKQLNISEIEILPCHNLGEKKYKRLNIPYERFSYNFLKLQLFEKTLKDNLINCTILFI